MKHIANVPISENLQTSIDVINTINFDTNQQIIEKETYILSWEYGNELYPNRISSAAQNSFAITQSFYHNGTPIYLIVINEQKCNELNANLTAVLLHEIGHVINEFGKKLSPMQAIQQNINDLTSFNENIQIENEFHADYIVKKYGYSDEAIHNLKISLSQGFNDEEISRRIMELQSDRVRVTNIVRSHSI
jgi:hypothetical protein